MAALAARLEAARAGTPSVVVVQGAAGMGKTALVGRALQPARGFRVLGAGADEGEARVMGGVVAQLARAAERLQGLAPPAPDGLLDPFATGAELLDLLGRLQEHGPVAVVVDDIQWADTFSVQAVAFALRRLQNDHVVAVFTAREEPPGLPQAIGRLAGERGGILRLAGLGAQAMTELAAAVRGRALSRRAAQQLCAHTGGNPLHARALLEELADDDLEGTGGVLPAPSSFTMVVAARLAACASETVDLVQAAAVLGPRSLLGAVASVAGVADPAAAVDEAVASGLLVMCQRREVGFPHPLVRAAVYHDLSPSRRSALHMRAASVSDGPAALFHRVEAALVEDPGLAREVEAHARQQLARGALASGAETLLAAARLHADRSVRSGLVLDAVEAFLGAGEIAKAAAVANDLSRAAESTRGQQLLGRLALFTGRQPEAEALLTRAWQLWEQEGPPELGASVAADVAQLCAIQLRSAEAADWARRAIDASTDPEQTTTALSILVPCLGRVGRPREAFTAASSAQQASEEATSVQVEAVLGRGIVRLWVDDLEEARCDMRAVLAACRDHPAGRQALVALGMLAETEYRLGAWDDSVAHGAQVVSLVEDSEQVWFGAFAHSSAARALAPRGHIDRAQAHAEAAAKAGAVLGDATSVGCAATAAAHVAFFRGDMAGAIQAVQPMLDLGERGLADEPSVHPWRELHAEALLRLGHLDDADAVLTALEALATAQDRRSSLAHVARLRGVLAGARGDPDAARAHFDAAVTRAGGLGAPFELARTHNDYGGFLRRLGGRRAAAAHLRAALEGFTALGAVPLADRCQQELSACGAAPATPADRTRIDLTPQELAVARLVAAGRTNREVAAELIVSPKTVEYHLSHLYAKLGVRSRTDLASRVGSTAPDLTLI